jgi:hypothetical protein
MAAVEKIAIDVPLAVAEAYRHATEPQRLQIANQIASILRVATVNRQDAAHRLQQTMDDISNEAVANGLTPEILESILNEP